MTNDNISGVTGVLSERDYNTWLDSLTEHQFHEHVAGRLDAPDSRPFVPVGVILAASAAIMVGAGWALAPIVFSAIATYL